MRRGAMCMTANAPSSKFTINLFFTNLPLGQAAGNNSLTDGIEYATWRNVYDGHRAIFDASVKDPLVPFPSLLIPLKEAFLGASKKKSTVTSAQARTGDRPRQGPPGTSSFSCFPLRTEEGVT